MAGHLEGPCTQIKASQGCFLLAFRDAQICMNSTHCVVTTSLLSSCPFFHSHCLSYLSLSRSTSTTSLPSPRPAPSSPPPSPPRERRTCARSPASGWPSPWTPASAGPSHRLPLPPPLPRCRPTTPDLRDPPSPPPPPPSETSPPRTEPTAPLPRLRPRLTPISATPLLCLPPPRLSTVTEAKVSLRYSRNCTQLSFCPQQGRCLRPKALLPWRTNRQLRNLQKRSLL